MRLEAIEVRHVRLPLVTPFRTAEGTQTVRDALLVRVIADVGEGWGECVAQLEPTYTSEHLAGAWAVMNGWLGPALLAADELSADDVAGLLAFVQGHRMAKAALELAVLDAELRAAGTSLATPARRRADGRAGGRGGRHPADDRRPAGDRRWLPRRRGTGG